MHFLCLNLHASSNALPIHFVMIAPMLMLPCPLLISRPRSLACHRRSIHVVCSSLKADVLVLDATNILTGRAAPDRRRLQGAPGGPNLKQAFAEWVAYLSLLVQPGLLVACFDAQKGQGSDKVKRSELASGYLQRRRRVQKSRAGGSSTPPSPPAKVAGGLGGIIDMLGGQGSISVVSQDGWEADDCVGAVCRLLEGAHPSLSVAVASGDSDMQQLLSPQVSWLSVKAAPSLQHPLGVELVTAAQFEQQHGFPPQAYPDFLAFVGKRDSSIGGVGTGASTASKLLKRYGSLEGIESAAARGELAGWSVAVQRLFAGDAAELQRRLHTNRRIFAVNSSLELLPEQQRAAILDSAARLVEDRGASSTAPAGGSDGSSSDGLGSGTAELGDASTAELVWWHPLHAGRWRYIEQEARQLAAVLQRSGGVAETKSVSAAGLAVDVLVRQGAELLGAGEGTVAVVVAGLCDLQQGAAASTALGPAEAADAELAAAASRSSTKVRQLNGAMQQHVRLLKKEGLQVVCLPHWQVPQG